MTTLETVLANARAQGVAYFAGVSATADGFNSPRLASLIPAMEAISAKQITLGEDMTGFARDLTLAYAKAAYNKEVPYADKSLQAQVSKTVAYLASAKYGFGLEAIKAVQDMVRQENDEKVKHALTTGVFEKLYKLLLDGNTAWRADNASVKVYPSRATVLAVFNPPKPDKSKHDKLADAFSKLAKLATTIGGLDEELYKKAMEAETRRYEERASFHIARAKAIKEATEREEKAVQPVLAPMPVVYDTALAGDNVDETLLETI